MKSTLNMKTTGKTDYPILMLSKTSGNVVLMEAPERGIVVFRGDGVVAHDVGYYSSVWVMEHFEPFNGQVILEN